MQPRMKHPIAILPEAMKAMMALGKAADAPNLPPTLFPMIHLRASQINGCSFCAEMHSEELKKGGMEDKKIYTVAAWREAPYFTDAERAALALTEAATRLSDRPDPVPDDVWQEAAKHFDETALSAILLHIGLINVWNRLNVSIRQTAGVWS